MTDDAKKRILDQQPSYSFEQPALARDEVRSVALGLRSVEVVNELKVLAFAFYIGALDESEIQERLGYGSMQDALAELLFGLTPISPKEIVEAMPAYYTGYAGWLKGRSVDEGWALTIVAMLYRCTPEKLDALFEIPDPSFFALRWTLGMVWDSRTIQQAIDVWTVSRDAVLVEGAAVLFWRSIESTVGGGRDLASLEKTDSMTRVIIYRNVLSRMLPWRRQGTWNEGLGVKFSHVVEAIRPKLEADLKGRPAVSTFLKTGRIGVDVDLIAFALSLSLDRTARDSALRNAHKTLSVLFGRISSPNPFDADAIHYVAQWMINSLASIAVAVPISAEFFQDLQSKLRYDEFAYGFNHAHYLVDRPRALVLASIGAIVGTVRGDELLKELARDLVRRLDRLPKGAHDVFSVEFVGDFQRLYDVQLPHR